MRYIDETNNIVQLSDEDDSSDLVINPTIFPDVGNTYKNLTDNFALDVNDNVYFLVRGGRDLGYWKQLKVDRSRRSIIRLIELFPVLQYKFGLLILYDDGSVDLLYTHDYKADKISTSKIIPRKTKDIFKGFDLGTRSFKFHALTNTDQIILYQLFSNTMTTNIVNFLFPISKIFSVDDILIVVDTNQCMWYSGNKFYFTQYLGYQPDAETSIYQNEDSVFVLCDGIFTSPISDVLYSGELGLVFLLNNGTVYHSKEIQQYEITGGNYNENVVDDYAEDYENYAGNVEPQMVAVQQKEKTTFTPLEIPFDTKITQAYVKYQTCVGKDIRNNIVVANHDGWSWTLDVPNAPKVFTLQNIF